VVPVDAVSSIGPPRPPVSRPPAGVSSRLPSVSQKGWSAGGADGVDRTGRRGGARSVDRAAETGLVQAADGRVVEAGVAVGGGSRGGGSGAADAGEPAERRGGRDAQRSHAERCSRDQEQSFGHEGSPFGGRAAPRYAREPVPPITARSRAIATERTFHRRNSHALVEGETRSGISARFPRSRCGFRAVSIPCGLDSAPKPRSSPETAAAGPAPLAGRAPAGPQGARRASGAEGRRT
jgi:hypothetical protein